MILPITAKIDPMPYESAFGLYRDCTRNGDSPSLLLESRTHNPHYGRQSLVISNPAVRITGKNEHFCLEALTETGEQILGYFSQHDFLYATDLKFGGKVIEGRVEKQHSKDIEQHAHIREVNTSYVIRSVLGKFQGLTDDHAGLYGAFSYDFARNFQNFGTRFSEGGGPDFELFLPSTVVSFDDIREQASIKRFFFDGKNDDLERRAQVHTFSSLPVRTYEDMSLSDYSAHVAHLIAQIKIGELQQCVLSRTQGISLQKHPLASYTQLRESNPSPYSFYFSFGNNRFLYGASPEIHVKVNNGEIEMRPIAGTIRRGKTPEEDLAARQKLLNDRKERAEHAMLVDLATSELHMICDPTSVGIIDEFSIEEYPNLFHMVSGTKGRLQPEFDALHALLTTIPAGTLSGSPKLKAMRLIEELEGSRRNFYGGAIGYLSFNGNANTGITIRSVSVRDGMSYVRAGAGVVRHSTPEGETAEIALKAEKAMAVLS